MNKENTKEALLENVTLIYSQNKKTMSFNLGNVERSSGYLYSISVRATIGSNFGSAVLQLPSLLGGDMVEMNYVITNNILYCEEDLSEVNFKYICSVFRYVAIESSKKND